MTLQRPPPPSSSFSDSDASPPSPPPLSASNALTASHSAPCELTLYVQSDPSITSNGAAASISAGGAASFHRYAATSIVVFAPSIAPLATFREALSFASRTSARPGVLNG